MKVKQIFEEIIKQTGKFRQDHLQELQKRYDACTDPEKKKKIKQEIIEFGKGFKKF